MVLTVLAIQSLESRSKHFSGTQSNTHHLSLCLTHVLYLLMPWGGNSNKFWIWNLSFSFLSHMLSLTLQTDSCTLSSVSTFCACPKWLISWFINTLLWFLLSFIIVLLRHNSCAIKFMFQGIHSSGFYCTVFQPSSEHFLQPKNSICSPTSWQPLVKFCLYWFVYSIHSLSTLVRFFFFLNLYISRISKMV